MQRKKLNPWSVVAMLSAVGMCPIFSIASILLGIRALVDIKAKGDTRGAGLAWAAILVGSLVTGLWGGGMLWWNKNVRSNIEQGPIVAIMYAQDERVDLFEEALLMSPSQLDAEQFINNMQQRYGKLLSGGLNQSITDSPVDGNNLFFGMIPIEAEISYILHFEHKKDVQLIAKFSLFCTVDEKSQFTNKFSWLLIKDSDLGDLMYPATIEESERSE